MRVPVGACTWMFGDLELEEVARRLAAWGMDGVELLGNLDRYRAEDVAAVLAAHGLTVFSLTPGNVDLAHPDPAIRGAAVNYYLRLLDFAAALGQPLVSCHGHVGRIRAHSSQAEERGLFARAVRTIARRAHTRGLRLVLEVLNRYESHLNNTAAETLEFLDEVGEENVGLLLDAYHMNIEEADPAEALREAGARLWLYHAADSNRQAIGRGHTNWPAQFAALREIGYNGPVVLECPAPGPDPFTAVKGERWLEWLETYLRESVARLGALSASAG